MVRLASAFKWISDAYVVECARGKPISAEINAPTMRSGYDGLNPLLCSRNDTTQGCFTCDRNMAFTPRHVGRFNCNGSHDQKSLIDLGLGRAGAKTLDNDLDRQLANASGLRDAGKSPGIHYLASEPGDGMITTPAAYDQSLCRLICGEYQLGRMLGQYAVRTEPGTCPTTVSTPAALSWYHMLNYWIKDQPNDDGAFSSIGAFGFYSWIVADKRYYGVFVRETFGPHAYVRSAACGMLIRRASAEGKPQHPVESTSGADFGD